MRSFLTVACLLTLGLLPAAEREADHAALRQLLVAVTKDLNTADFTALDGRLAPGFHLTFADQRTFTAIADLAAYRTKLTGEYGITAITFAPEVDGPAQFLDETTGLCTGRSTDSFTSAGGVTSITSRWTATVVRDAAGAWKVAGFHAGVDLLDNPILERTRAFGRTLAWGAGGLGLLIGLGVGVLLGRRRA